MNFILALLNNKYVKYALIMVGAIIFFWFLYNNIYQKGYEAGSDKQKIIQQENEVLLQKHYKELQQKAVEESLKTIKKDVEIKTIYKDKIKEVEKIVTKTEYKDCKLNEEDYTKFVNILEQIK